MVRALLLIVATIAIVLYAAGIVAIFTTSPTITHIVHIDAPVETVWKYASDSNNATEWSVYFDHITPMTGKGLPKDGTIGALRICYRTANERGPQWTERTMAVEPLRHRQIRTFNLQQFPGQAIAGLSEHDVHQDYRRIDDTHSTLRFRTTLMRPKGIVATLAYPYTRLAYAAAGKRDAKHVFVANLENIKAASEARYTKTEYVRPHPYEPLRWFEKRAAA